MKLRVGRYKKLVQVGVITEHLNKAGMIQQQHYKLEGLTVMQIQMQQQACYQFQVDLYIT